MPVGEALSLLLFILALSAGILLLYWESRRWVPFYGAAAHRPEELVRVAASLHRAGVRHRVKNVVTVGSESAVGAGMSSTILVHRDDVRAAQRVLNENRER